MRRRSRGSVAILIALSTPALAIAADPPPPPPGRPAAAKSEAQQSEHRHFSLFPPQLSVGPLSYLPKLYYSQETNVGVGGALLYLPDRVGSGAAAVRSSVSFDGQVTFKGQAEAELVTSLAQGPRRVKAKVVFSNLPLRYYGIGPDTPRADEELYQPQSLLSYLEVFRDLGGSVRIGTRIEWENFQLLETEADGLLATKGVRGAQRGDVVGTGLTFAWDTTDREESPAGGHLYEGFAMIFENLLGGDYDFNVYNVDLRNYFSIGRSHVVATQLFLYATAGAAPFWRLAALGGRPHTRGYRKARYIDNLLLAFQAEYRFAVAGRFGLVSFAGVGDVAPRLGRLKLEHMRPTLGGGLRYAVSPSRGLNARLDLAVGNSLRGYLALGEAF